MKRLIITVLTLAVIAGALPFTGSAALSAVPAKAAVLMDSATGTVLYEQSSHTPLPLASVTKVMTMLLVMEAIESGAIGWDDPVTASESAAAKGGSQIYLKVGETMPVSTLLKAVAVSSANDAACALAEHIAGSEEAFAERMNSRAAQLGMENTHFINCTGLDDDENAKNHYSSAYDIALMSRQLLQNHPDIKKYTTVWMDTIRDGSFGLANTNKLVRFYPGATGLKTGYTSLAGFCLSASAQKDGMELIAVVLGCESSAQRFDACKRLLDQGFAGYALILPEPEETAVKVELGKKQTVTAVISGNSAVLIDKGQKSSVTVTTELQPAVTAPVSRGQRLGTVSVLSGDQILAQLPLVAQEAVERLSWGEIFVITMKQLCFGG